jgi:hypothetical protein
MVAKLLTGSLLVLFSLNGVAQNPFMDDANGRPLYLRTSYSGEGSPYFSETYNEAEVTGADGKLYRNVRVKINLLDNEVLYLDAAGKEMIATMPIQKIRLLGFIDATGVSDKVLKSNGQSLNTPNAPVYEVMDSGRCVLLKQVKVTFKDEKRYNEASVTRVFKRIESYFVLMAGGKLQKLGQGKEDVLAILKDKEALVRAFIDMNNLKCRRAEDYKQVFGYYNSLF